MIASSRNPKFQALKKKLAEYDKADDAFNKATQQMSDCMMIEAPKVACEKKVCVKLP